MSKDLKKIWYNPDQPWQKLFVIQVSDGKNYACRAIGVNDYITDQGRYGLICTEDDLYKWGWLPEITARR